MYHLRPRETGWEKSPATDSRKQFAIPDELWSELKISNIRRGVTMPQALQEAVEGYLKTHKSEGRLTGIPTWLSAVLHTREVSTACSRRFRTPCPPHL